MIICDVDNCISDDAHRINYITEAWRGHARSSFQPPTLTPNDDAFHEYHIRSILDEIGDVAFLRWPQWSEEPIVFVTAMPHTYHALRTWWLRRNLPSDINARVEGCLFRAPGDTSSSPVAKLAAIMEFLAANGLAQERVMAMFDDREDVLAAYRENNRFPNAHIERIAIHD